MDSLSVRLAPHDPPPFTLSVRKQWFIWIVSHNVQFHCNSTKQVL